MGFFYGGSWGRITFDDTPNSPHLMNSPKGSQVPPNAVKLLIIKQQRAYRIINQLGPILLDSHTLFDQWLSIPNDLGFMSLHAIITSVKSLSEYQPLSDRFEALHDVFKWIIRVWQSSSFVRTIHLSWRGVSGRYCHSTFLSSSSGATCHCSQAQAPALVSSDAHPNRIDRMNWIIGRN